MKSEIVTRLNLSIHVEKVTDDGHGTKSRSSYGTNLLFGESDLNHPEFMVQQIKRAVAKLRQNVE